MKSISTWLFTAPLLFCALPYSFALDVGKPAPALKAKLTDGSSFDLAKANGKVVVINFWASWCEPCRLEMPAMETYYRQHKDEGLQLIAISMDDPADEAVARKIMNAYSYSFAFKRDADYKGYGRIWRMPMTFVVDRQGVLRRDGSVGDPKVDLPILEKFVTPLLTTAR